MHQNIMFTMTNTV